MKAPNLTLPFYVRLQRLFYIIPPNESMFETLEDVPAYVAESASAFQALMLLELIILWFQSKPLPRLSDLMTSVGAGIASRLIGLTTRRVVELAAYCYVWENYRLIELPWDSIWTWIFALLAVDFGYYWLHRAAHEVNFMWAAHQTHHSSEDYNLSTALRQSVIQAYNSWIFYMPLALCVPPPIYHVHQQFNLLYQFWIHTELIGWLGPLEYIINTPSAHRVHHGRNRYCIDKNYGGTFIFFDIIFGTYEAEKREQDSVVYGLVHPLESRNPFYIQLCHWQHILTTAYNRPGFVNKVKTFVFGPGWEPGKPRMGDINDVPDIKYPAPKYETPVPMWYNFYAIIHFILVLAIHQNAEDHVSTYSQLHVMLSIAFILISLTCIGSLFDQRSYAPYMEFIRCVTVSVYLWNSFEIFHMLTLPLIILFATSSLIYGVIICRRINGVSQSEHQKLT